MNTHWTDILREKMESHQEPEPEKLWSAIEQRINNRHSIIFRKIGIATAAAAAAVLLLLSILNHITPTFNAPVMNGKNLIVEAPAKISYSRITRVSAPLPVGHKIALNTDNSAENEHDADIGGVSCREVPDNETYNTGKIIPDTIITSNSQMPKAAKKDTSVSEKISFPDFDTLFEDEHDDFLNKQYSSNWLAGVYTSNLPIAPTKRGGLLAASEQSPLYDRDYPVEKQYRLPITIGLSGSYNFTKRWGFTSGITYTRLSSFYAYKSDDYCYKSEQILQNIGIACNVNYNLWYYKRFSLYAAAGGLVEKNISGKLYIEESIDNKLVTNINDSFIIKQLQWAVSASAGLKYKLTERIGLYFEPGVTYYFDNSADTDTYYMDNPLNFCLKIGLSFSLSSI